MALPETHQWPFEQQKQRAADIVHLLSLYTNILDSYVIEFFSENLWELVPCSWRETLSDLKAPQLSMLLLEQGPCAGRQSVWPLSLLAYRAAAHALAFPRQPREACSPPPHVPSGAGPGGQEFRADCSHSPRISRLFCKHVKPKKQHEIQRLGALVKKLCDSTGCERVVDIGSGQGHLSRYLAFGHGLCLTGVEAGTQLVATARSFDRQLLLALHKDAARRRKTADGQEAWGPEPARILLPRHVVGRVDPGATWQDLVRLLEPEEGSPEREGWGWCQPFVLTGLHACGDLGPAALRLFAHCPSARGITAVSCCYMKASASSSSCSGPADSGYPMSAWVRALPGHALPYKLRETACHAIEDYAGRLRVQHTGLRVHCYRAVLETIVRRLRPSVRRPALQLARNAHLLPFDDYARAGLRRLGLDPETRWDTALVQSMLGQEGKVIAYFCLNLLLAPAIETLILLDRLIYLQEQGIECALLPLFEPRFSPRNFVLVGAKAGGRVRDLLRPEEGAPSGQAQGSRGREV
uniref:methyltransferase-like protein 25B isoform X2 n=1 Tax=Pristiophorus japonicus TaxID=55135 RepID=UPI00398ECED6